MLICHEVCSLHSNDLENICIFCVYVERHRDQDSNMREKYERGEGKKGRSKCGKMLITESSKE